MALMDDLGKALKDGKIDSKEIEKMAKDVMPGLDLGSLNLGGLDLGMLANGMTSEKQKDTKKSSKNTKSAQNTAGVASGMNQEQMAQIMSMLGSLDLKNLDPDAIAKQFGIPAETVKQVLAMLKK